MKKSNDNGKIDRRKFLHDGFRYTLAIGIGGLGVAAAVGSSGEELVWQLNPAKCVQCGRCATNCVLTPSAVKCMHVYDMCGYCDLCSGYFRVNTKDLTTAAENQLCPTSAIERRFIEEPYFEYHIDEALCFGCGKCVEGCGAFGNGSLQLQVNQNLCVNCNECAIARECPADAYSRIPAGKGYQFTGFNKEELL